MSWDLQNFFYEVYQNLEESVSAGARWVGETAEACYNVVTGPVEWIYEALQGDWNDERTPAQIAADAVLAMVPIIDQILDIRDICANCRKLREDASSWQSWMSLCFCLIGLIPTVGSLVKGVLKIIFVYVRKLGSHAVIAAVDTAIESVKLFLKNEKVVKILGSYDLAKCYRLVADELRIIIGKINAKDLADLFKKATDNFGSLIDALNKVLPERSIAVLRNKYGDMVVIQSQIGNNIDKCLGPVKDILGGIAGRLEARAMAVSGKAVGAETRVAVAGGKGAAAASEGRAVSAGGKEGGTAADVGRPHAKEGGAPESAPSAQTSPVPTESERTARTNAQNPDVEGNSTLRWEDMPGKTKNAQKGLYGEVVSDNHMIAEGHASLLPTSRKAIDNLEAKARDAYFIDGIYKNANPPKTYIITEAKFRTGGKFTANDLPTTKGSTHNDVYYPEAKQMSDPWIAKRLENDPALTLKQVREISGDYERLVLIVDESGKVVKKIELDALGNAIKR